MAGSGLAVSRARPISGRRRACASRAGATGRRPTRTSAAAVLRRRASRRARKAWRRGQDEHPGAAGKRAARIAAGAARPAWLFFPGRFPHRSAWPLLSPPCRARLLEPAARRAALHFPATFRRKRAEAGTPYLLPSHLPAHSCARPFLIHQSLRIAAVGLRIAAALNGICAVVRFCVLLRRWHAETLSSRAHASVWIRLFHSLWKQRANG